MKNIKIGACDWGLPGNGLYATQIAAAAGLDALSLKIGLHEFDYPLTQPEMQKIYLNEQQKYGIEYCAIALNDFDNIPMHARKGTKAYDIVWDLLKRAVHTAKALGVQMIQVPGFAASEIKNEHGISVAGENVMNVKEFRTLYDMVDRKNFYLYFDSQNYYLNRGYRETDILEGLYPLMCNQLHVKDGADGALSGSLLGTGDSRFFETMTWLDQHSYTGYILLENYYDQMPLRTQAENPYDLLREDIKILKTAIG